MSELSTFISLGFHHIADPRAFDHLLFVITLCAMYRLTDWRKVVVLVTAFTIGHCITLVLSGLRILSIPTALVEMLIPVTICLTALYNITAKSTDRAGVFSRAVGLNYLMAMFFGLIHGMGFANYFSALMPEDGNLVMPLFGFNLGIELGQIMIVVCFLGIYALLSRFFSIAHRDWKLFISGAGFGVALTLIIGQIFE